MLGVYVPTEVWDVRSVCPECTERIDDDASFYRVGRSEDPNDECYYCGGMAILGPKQQREAWGERKPK